MRGNEIFLWWNEMIFWWNKKSKVWERNTILKERNIKLRGRKSNACKRNIILRKQNTVLREWESIAWERNVFCGNEISLCIAMLRTLKMILSRRVANIFAVPYRKLDTEWIFSCCLPHLRAMSSKVIHDTLIYIFNLACQILPWPRYKYVLKMHKNAFHSWSFLTNAGMAYSAGVEH